LTQRFIVDDSMVREAFHEYHTVRLGRTRTVWAGCAYRRQL